MGPRSALALAAVPVLALTAGLPFANRLEPLVLGLPFLLFWMLAWVLLTPAFLAAAYVLVHRGTAGSRTGLRNRDGESTTGADVPSPPDKDADISSVPDKSPDVPPSPDKGGDVPSPPDKGERARVRRFGTTTDQGPGRPAGERGGHP